MRYEVTIQETGHRRRYGTLGTAKAQGKRLLRSLIGRGLIFGRREFDVRDTETGETQTITIY